MDKKLHWDNIFKSRGSEELGWHQDHLGLSLELIQAAGLGLDASLIDVGGGDSTLVDDLLKLGYTHLTVLDISSIALQRVRQRRGRRAAGVHWIEADITQADLPRSAFDLWHDRAVFHFLTRPEDRQRYVRVVRQALKPGGFVILAVFALDGPERCSGLEVVRYDPQQLAGELGGEFRLRDVRRETHCTPGGVEQKFIYCVFQTGITE